MPGLRSVEWYLGIGDETLATEPVQGASAGCSITQNATPTERTHLKVSRSRAASPTDFQRLGWASLAGAAIMHHYTAFGGPRTVLTGQSYHEMKNDYMWFLFCVDGNP